MRDADARPCVLSSAPDCWPGWFGLWISMDVRRDGDACPPRLSAPASRVSDTAVQQDFRYKEALPFFKYTLHERC